MAFGFIRKHRLTIPLIIIIVLILPFLIVYLAISIPPARRIILNYAESAINKQIVGEIRISDFHTDIFSYLTLYGIVAGDKRSAEDSLSVKQIDVRWHSRALLKKRVAINKVTITNVNAAARRDDGKLFFPLMPKPHAKENDEENEENGEEKRGGKPPPEKETKPWEFSINSVEMRDANLSFSDSKFHVALDLHLNADVEFKKDSITFKVMADTAVLSVPVITWRLDTLFLAGYIDGDNRFHLEHFRINSDLGHIDASEIAPFLEDGFWDLNSLISSLLNRAVSLNEKLNANAIVKTSGISKKRVSPLPKEVKLNIVFDLPEEYDTSSAKLDITFKGGRWSVTAALGELNKLEGGGTVSNDSISGTVNALLLEPQFITARYINPPVTGKISVRSKISGLISSPDINAVITSPNLNWNGINADTLYAKAAFNGGKLVINESRLELNADLNTQTALAIPVKGKFNATVKAFGAIENLTASADFSVKHIYYNNIYLDIIEGNALYRDGAANLNAAFSQQITDGLSVLLNSKFSFSNNTVSGSGGLMLSQPNFIDTNALFFSLNLPLQSQNKTAAADGGKIRINSDAFPLGLLTTAFIPEINTDAVISVDARADLKQSIWALSGNAFVQIDAMDYGEKKLLAADVPVNAVFSGTAQNPLISIAAQKGRMECHDIEARIVNIQAAFSRNDITVNTLRLGFDHDGYAAISAYYPLDKKTPPLLGMRVAYDLKRFPIAVFSPVLKRAQVESGVINGRGDFAFGDSVTSFGFLRVDSLTVKHEKINRAIGPIYATLTHDNEWVSLPYLRGRLGGPFKILGRMRCSEKAVETINLFAEGENIRFRYGSNIDLGLGAVEVVASGRDNKIDSISGYVNLGETRYYQNLAVLDLIEQALTIKTERQPDIPRFLAPARVNLDLRLKSNAIVITSAGRMHLTGRLIFEGTAAEPTVNGEIRLIQAHIRYLDRKFDIGDEYIRRMRPVAIDRLIYPVNREPVRTYMFDDQKDFIIGAAVSGSLYEPDAMLTSHPPLKSEYIVSLLTQGSIVTIPSTLYSPLEVASVYAGGWVAWELMSLTDITFIDINGNFNEFNEERGPQLTLFQRFTERIYGSYQLQMGRPEDQALSVIYRFMPRFFISGTAGTKNSGAGLWYFFRR